jgi:DNA-directed RNA polymerase specialized sigma24 family protein
MEATLAAHDRTVQIEELYRSDGERLWRAVYAYAGDGDVASDAVAEAFAQLLRRGTDLRDSQRWVWRAAFKIPPSARAESNDHRRTTMAL